MSIVKVVLLPLNNISHSSLNKRLNLAHLNFLLNLLPPPNNIQTHTSNQTKLNNIIANRLHNHQHHQQPTPKPYNNKLSIPHSFNNILLTTQYTPLFKSISFTYAHNTQFLNGHRQSGSTYTQQHIIFIPQQETQSHRP